MATRVITIASSHMTSEAPTKWWGPLGNLVNPTRQSAVRTVINIYMYIMYKIKYMHMEDSINWGYPP